MCLIDRRMSQRRHLTLRRAMFDHFHRSLLNSLAAFIIWSRLFVCFCHDCYIVSVTCYGCLSLSVECEEMSDRAAAAAAAADITAACLMLAYL